ncbi:MAG TPA: SBBP repeat-containing protein, partial [Bryobacteraceae bacterium]|nr:SBBP repeat-containing protein [Bryobacteraceae bacterium]
MRALIFSILTLPYLAANSFAAAPPPVLPFEARGSEYLSRGPAYAMSVTPRRELLIVDGHAVSMSAVNANANATLEPLDRMPGRANYFIGRDVRSYDLYGRLRWRSVYPGIDAIFHASREHLEYDFEISARRDPARIQLAFSGIDRIHIGPDGDLVLTAGDRTIHQPRPVAYQMVAGKRRLVDIAYRLDASNRVLFRTGAYDRTLPLVIDPEIVFDKTFGGSGQTTVLGMTRDSQGNLYVTGSTNATDLGATKSVFQPHLGTAPLIVTTNAGQTWNFPTLPGAVSVYSIASAPSSPSTFYAGTPIGVFQSTDAGITWKTTSGTGLAGPATTLAVDSNSSTTVYAGTAQSLYVSTDGAMSWHAATNGISGQGIASIAPSRTQPGTVFVSVQNPPAVFRSADSGQTWTMLTFPVTLQGPVDPILFTSTGAIIAATYEGIMISNDGGNTWTPGASVHTGNNQGLAISLNSNTLYVFDAASSQLERSTDGGLTFNPVPISAKLSFLTRIAVDPKNPSTVYAADYNLLYRSTDSGQTWSQLSPPYTINPQTVFVSPVDSRLFLGAFTQTNAFVTKWSPD